MTYLYWYLAIGAVLLFWVLVFRRDADPIRSLMKDFSMVPRSMQIAVLAATVCVMPILLIEVKVREFFE